MTRIVRSNTPSLYDNPKLSAKALNNQYTNCVFKRAATSTVASTSKGLDAESKWTIGLGLLGLASTFALGLINKKTEGTDDTEAKAKAETEAKAKAEEETKAKAKSDADAKLKAENNEKLKVEADAKAEVKATSDDDVDSKNDNTQTPTDTTEKNTTETASLGSESNPVPLGEVVINGTAPKPFNNSLKGLTITAAKAETPSSAIALNSLITKFNTQTPAPNAQGEQKANVATQTPTSPRPMSKEEKDAKMDLLQKKLAKIQDSFSSLEGDFNAVNAAKLQENIVKHEITNLEKVQIKEG